MKKSIVAFICGITSMAFATNQEFDSKGLKGLNLKIISGDVRIVVSEDKKAHIATDKIIFDKNCTLKMNRVGNELFVEVEKENSLNLDECKINFEIKVPKEIALNVKIGSGDLEIRGTKGRIEFLLGSGDVKINAEVENLVSKSGSGSILVAGLAGSAEVKTGSGDVTLKYRLPSLKGTLDIRTGSGDATVYLPSSMKILTDFKSGTGHVYNELGDSIAASFTISMRAGRGNLKVKRL